MKYKLLRLLAWGMLLSAALGCARTPASKPLADTDRNSVPPIADSSSAKQTISSRNDGSLFTPEAAFSSPWRDDTAHSIGDIVTVQIMVDNSAQNTATTDLKRDSSLNAGITSLFGYEGKLPGVNYKPTETSKSDPYNSTTPAQLIKADSTSSFQGAGDTARTGKVVANVSAMVTQLYPNGNMGIRGSQSLLINNENSFLTVEGVIRPSDIAINNIINSDCIANARIEVTGRGVVSEKQRPGLLMRAFDVLWPF